MEFKPSTPRITVGVPVYNGADLIAKSLECLQQQTYGNFEVIISVDGADEKTAEACRPFLTDRRFRMVVHPHRLDWVGNFNWLLQQNLREFFCYRQHDDTTAPEFFEILLQAADREPGAAATYCDCRYVGMSDALEVATSINGEPLDRMFQFVERLQFPSGAALRGLIRKPAIAEAGLVRSDEFRASLQVHNWLAKLLRGGSFNRVPQPLYYRLDHPQSFTRKYFSKSEEWKRAVWTTMFTGMLEAAIPLCRTPQERLFFQCAILDRIVAYPNFGPNDDLGSFSPIIGACMERLRYEGNTHLLREDELAAVIGQLPARVKELRSLERAPIRRGISRLRQRARLASLLYPSSRLRTLCYLFRYLLAMIVGQSRRIAHIGRA